MEQRLFCIKTMLWLETGLLSGFSQGQSMSLQSIHWKLLMSICLSTFLLPNTRTCIVHTNEGLSRKHTLQQSIPSRYKTCLSIRPSVRIAVCLKTSLRDIGLDVRDDKCKLYCPSADSGSATIIPVAVHGIEVLGTPIGTPNYVESKYEAKAEERMARLGSTLRDLDEPQSALLLLKHCHVSKLPELWCQHIYQKLLPFMTTSQNQFLQTS